MEKAVIQVISEHVIYDIMYTVGWMILYTLVIWFGWNQSAREHKRAFLFSHTLKEVIEDIKHLVSEEETELSHVNKLSLSDLLNNKPTDENYAEVIDLLTELARITYADFKFFIAKSPDETQQSNFLQIVSSSKEEPYYHASIFAKAVTYGINMQELQKRFADHVAAGNVIDLGEDTVVILNDGSPQLPTGVSPINNGLEGGEIAFIISFIKKENLEAFNKNNLPQETEDESAGA